jgi:two-component system response regulator MprA
VNLLLVEDDVRMRNLVRRGLVEQGHTVSEAATGPGAIDAGAGADLDVIILDVMLPGCDGVEVVRQLRGTGVRTPVLMLTARDAAEDIVSSLDAGADDYLAKPFSFAVLLARIRALGRRGPALLAPRLTVADLVLDSATRAVSRSGRQIALTRTEFNLLECLMRHVGRVMTRQALIDRVWGATREIESNTLEAFVKTLRLKVDYGGGVKLIHTVRGVGYSIRTEPEP